MASALATFVILILLAFTLVPLAVNERDESANHVVDGKARHIAETGLELGIEQFRRTRVPPHFADVPFGTGKYTVRFDILRDETGTMLPWCNYVMVKSMGKVETVERNMRMILSSLPHAFLFALYSQNLENTMLDLEGSIVDGYVYFRGNVVSTLPVSRTVYTPPGFSSTSGSVVYHPDPQPPLPYLDQSPFLALLETAATVPSGDFELKNPKRKGKLPLLLLSDYINNILYVNGDVELDYVRVKGPGKIVATDTVRIIATSFQDDIFIVGGEATQIRNSSVLGTAVCSPSDGVIIYSGGEVAIDRSIVYGLGISMGKFDLVASSYYGAFLTFGGGTVAAQNTVQNSTIVGSLVAKNNLVLSNTAINRGPLPLALSQDIGLEPYIVPGTWLEY